MIYVLTKLCQNDKRLIIVGSASAAKLHVVVFCEARKATKNTRDTIHE